MDIKSFFKKNPSNDELYVFFVQLATFTEAGESVLLAFDSMGRQTENEILRSALKEIPKAIMRGETLAQAFSAHDFFPRFCIQAIHAGEESGTLEEALNEIANHLEKIGDIKRRIQSALLPVKIIAFLLSISISIAVSIVIPKFQQMYVDLQITLPFITRLVVMIINFFINYWYIHLFFLSIGFYSAKKYKKQYPEKIDALMFEIPIYKHVYYYMLQYRFCKIFGLLQTSGIGPAEALEITANALDNAIFAKVLRKSAHAIRGRGVDLSTALQENNQDKILDFIIINFIVTGESTGGINLLLEKASKYYEKVLDSKIRDFSEEIGPAFLSPMMGVIIFVIMAIYYPILTMTQAIK